ncbi:MAG TPA: UvrB/UvrC motif-containing protein [Gemmatimonadales bacterium]|jgi:protein arginine kinase activator|nr:UvrB/UvrC motif-containing protein [Gemmatimonadales bacterium]
MSCEQCHEREAVIHLTQIVNEQVTTLHLCERCAADKGVENPGALPKTPLGTFLAAMGQESSTQTPAPRSGDTCSRCGGTLQDFRETGRLGCPDCYRSFESPLRDLLRRLHGSTHHVGERYADKEVTTAPSLLRPQAAELREQLRLAVETENFELAAELRDRLRVME